MIFLENFSIQFSQARMSDSNTDSDVNLDINLGITTISETEAVLENTTLNEVSEDELVSDLLEDSVILLTGFHKRTHKSGSIYEGEWLEGKKHGNGTYFWKSGDKYIGKWVENKKSGPGKYIFFSGDVFEGEFLAGKRNDQMSKYPL